MVPGFGYTGLLLRSLAPLAVICASKEHDFRIMVRSCNLNSATRTQYRVLRDLLGSGNSGDRLVRKFRLVDRIYP